MKKIESEYKELYGDISKDEDIRFTELLNSVNLSNKSRELLFPHIQNILHASWKEINFIIYLIPKATPRPRHSFKTNTFYVYGSKDNKDIFYKFISKLDIPMIVSPCKFYCTSYLPIPKSMCGEEKILAEMGLIRPISKPDWDNLGKTYSDMIQATLLYDDSLIIEGVSKKFYSAKPRIEISIKYMEGFDSVYNEKKMRKKVDLNEDDVWLF